MTIGRVAVALVALAGLTTRAARADVVFAGDRENGAALFRVQCAACHGVDGRGNGDLANKLPVSVGNARDPSLLATLSDDGVRNLLLKGIAQTGGPALMPASPWLSALDLADLLVFLREGQLKVADFFPHAQFFTAKSYPLDKAAQAKVQQLSGKSLGAGDATVTILSIFGDGGGASGTAGPTLVPQDPAQLDKLDPKDGKGYLMFTELPGGHERALVGIALNRAGQVTAVRSGALAAGAASVKAQPVDKAYQAFVGEGQKGALAPIKPKGKGAPPPAEVHAFNEAYLRALVGISLAEREEKDRHWADTK